MSNWRLEIVPYCDSLFGRTVLGYLMQSDVGGTDVDALPEDTEMVYSEFVEALVAMVYYKIPSPYTPYKARLEVLLDQMLITPLIDKLKLKVVKGKTQGKKNKK